jgi:MFS family permease
MRQALWFGLLSTGIGLGALGWPLLASALIGNVAATIWIYAFAMLADVALFAWWLVLALRYARRADRGELFEVPLVSRLKGALSRKR